MLHSCAVYGAIAEMARDMTLDAFMTVAKAAADAFAQLHPGAAPVSTSPLADEAIAALEKVQLTMVA